jgi:hypothetical protein
MTIPALETLEDTLAMVHLMSILCDVSLGQSDNNVNMCSATVMLALAVFLKRLTPRLKTEYLLRTLKGKHMTHRLSTPSTPGANPES